MTFSQSPLKGAPPGGDMPQQASDLLLVLILSLIGLRLLFPLIVALCFDPDPATGNLEASAEAMAIALFFVTHSLVVLACVRAFALRRYGRSWGDLGVGTFERHHLGLGIAAGLLAIPAVVVVVLIVEAWMGQPIDNPQVEALAPIGTSFWAFLFIAGTGCTLIPFAEEIAFRGLFYQWLRQRWGIQIALIASALFFAAMHGALEIAPSLAVLGVIFAALLQITRSIWPSVIAHGTYNLVMMSLLYFELSGQGGGAAAGLLLSGAP